MTELLGQQPRGEAIQVFSVPHGTVPRLPQIAHGDGIYMWDTSGKRYIDVSSGPIANNIGHGNAHVLRAMQEQAGKVAFAYPGQFESEANVRLADLVTDMAGPGLDRAFFVSGGSEANESAVKLCRQYMLAIGQPDRCKVISRDPGYHGGTSGALALTGDRQMHDIFGALLPAHYKVPTPWTYRLPPNHTRDSYARHCAQALEDKIVAEGPDTVMAFIMEPVGGVATGALVAEDIYMTMVREICARHGVLLIYDEVMSGAGRTGHFLAADHWPDACPDMVVLAKGIAAGYTPMGAVLAPNDMVRAVAGSGGFLNGFTYCSNPLSCAVGAAVLEEVRAHGLVANAAARGPELVERLWDIGASNRVVGDVRGKGLLLAMELVTGPETKARIPVEMNAPAMVQRIAMDQGLAIYHRRTAYGENGDWLMIAPPLTVTSDQLDEITDGLRETLRLFEAELRSEGI
ncbi:MAG: aspartate aminotransferase family protein [Paracoccaceae bacterium]